MTSRRLYGYALIAGIAMETARKMEPGYIFDMYIIRTEYDARLAGIDIRRKVAKLSDL